MKRHGDCWRQHCLRMGMRANFVSPRLWVLVWRGCVVSRQMRTLLRPRSIAMGGWLACVSTRLPALSHALRPMGALAVLARIRRRP